MSEERDKRGTFEEAEMRDEGADVEAHKRVTAPEDKVAAKDIGATEEGPDVEAHKKVTKHQY